MKRQPVEQEKIFANDGTNKGLISKVCKLLIQLSNETNTRNKKMGRKAKQMFLQRRQAARPEDG